MPKSYQPASDTGKMQWLNNFAAKLPNYREALQLSTDTIKEVQNWSENFTYIISNMEGFREYTKQVTAYKNLMRSGSKKNAVLGPIPAAPATLVLPQAPSANIFGEISKLVQIIKNAKDYNEAMGKDLGIIGEASKKFADKKPSLAYKIKAGQPNIKWKKAGMQGIHFYVDRSDGKGYQFLATDTQPDYLDTHPLPATGQSAIWKYKAIYIHHDEETGAMSDELQVIVSGKL